MAAGIFFVGNLIFIVFGKGSIQPWNNVSRINATDSDNKGRMCKYNSCKNIELVACASVDLSMLMQFLLTRKKSDCLKLLINKSKPKFLDGSTTSRRSHNTDETLELLDNIEDEDHQD